MNIEKKTSCFGVALFTALLAAAIFTNASVASPQPAETPPIRLAYNYCTLSYTFAYYGEREWTAEVERLQKAGYNVALVMDGTFKVWELTLRELGLPEREIFEFIPDECARAWWLMDNISGEGGPLDQKTVDEDGERGRFIASQMRARGIEPLLQGFYGMIPVSLKEYKGRKLEILRQGNWGSYERPPMLVPTSQAFAEIAAVWYRNLEKVYGFKPKYLGGDLFHEGGKSGNIDVTAAARAVQAAQQKAFPGTTWAIQAWGKNPTKELRAGLDPRFTLIEALVYDMSSLMKDDAVCGNFYGDLPWIWCEVLNFGGNHGMGGNLKTFAHMGRAAKGKGAKTFRGYGSLSEGFLTNPVCYALFEDMMMRPAGSELSDDELYAWLDSWVERRYKSSDGRFKEAWRILAQTAYSCPRRQEGAVENVICAKPSWKANNARSWGPKHGLWYDSALPEKALRLVDDAIRDMKAKGGAVTAELAFDRFDLARQVLSEKLRSLVPRLKDDVGARKQFLDLAEQYCTDAAVRAAPPEFRLSTWEGMARRRAGERGAVAWKRMLTTWEDPAHGHTRLEDYANREYPELVRDHYLPRWKAFFEKAE